MRDPEEASGFSLQINSALAFETTWGMKQQKEDLSVYPLCKFPFLIKIKINDVLKSELYIT